MNNTKKYIFIIILIILGLIMICLSNNINNTYSNTNINTRNDTDYNLSKKSNISLKNNSDDMPPISSTQYVFNENRIINSIVSQGAIISSYKRVFINNSRKDYDIDSRYNDFNHDFEEYRINLKNKLLELQSANPSLDDAKYEQKNTIEKVQNLYDLISKYKNHNNSLNDTIKYLQECEYALNRVEMQAKLPN